MNKLVLGPILLLVGAGVTIYSYVATPVGGHFFIMTGLFASGLGLTVRGIIDHVRNGGRGPETHGAGTFSQQEHNPQPTFAAQSTPDVRAPYAEPAIPSLTADTSYLNKPIEQLSPHEAIAQRRAQRLAAEQANR